MLETPTACTAKALPDLNCVTAVAQEPDRKLLRLFNKREPLTRDEWRYMLAAEAAANAAAE